MDWATAIGLVETHTPQHVIALRLVLAGAFGALIGFEREASHRAAGLRTHILIALGAALFTILAFEIYAIALAGGADSPDPIRAVEATTAGIAFLGAGAIFQRRGDIKGITTGAGMWLAGAVGVATAIGLYYVAFGTALLAVLVLALLRTVSQRLGGNDGGKDVAEDAQQVHPGRDTGSSAHT